MGERTLLTVCLVWAMGGLSGAAEATPTPEPLPFPLIERFETYGPEQGIPGHKVHSVMRASDGRLWVGTYEGALVQEGDGFKPIGMEQGLSHRMVLSMVEDPLTGDIWIGTMRGLNHYSAGRVTVYTQMNSGLPNNVIYGLAVFDGGLWVATAAGLGVLDLKSRAWTLYDHNNSIMHEPWVYSITGAKDRVFVGVWGGGVLEFDPTTGLFKEHRDPDRDFHIDLVPDDGPVNDVTAWVGWSDGLLWQATYFGLARYDGSRWRTWQADHSPLPSDFVNFVWPIGRVAWIGTDRGLTVTDGDTWASYATNEDGQGVVTITRPGSPPEVRTLPTSLPNDFILGIWSDGQELWLGTSDGMAKAILDSAPNRSSFHKTTEP